MARKIEFIKKSEARIMMFLRDTKPTLKYGDMISQKLDIDYIYVMKLLRGMYAKGWIRTHMYDGLRFFNNTRYAPIEEAKQKLMDGQSKLKTNEENNKRQKQQEKDQGNKIQ